MPTYNVSIEMRQDQFQWKYTFYANHEGNAESCMNEIFGQRRQEEQNVLIAALQRVHENNTYIHALNVRNISGNRFDFRPRTVNIYCLLDVPLAGPGTTNRPDLVNASVKWRLYGAQGGTRLLSISGVPDDVIARFAGGAPDVPALYLQSMDALTSALNAKSLQIRVKKEPVVGQTNERFVVTDIDENPGSDQRETRIEYDSATQQYAAGQRIEFWNLGRQDVRLLPYLNQHEILEVGPNPLVAPAKPYVVIRAQYLGPAGGFKPDRVRVQRPDYTYSTILAQGDLHSLGTRQRGTIKDVRGREASVSYRHKR